VEPRGHALPTRGLGVGSGVGLGIGLAVVAVVGAAVGAGVGAGVSAITQPYTILMCASSPSSVRQMSQFDRYGLAAGHSTFCLSRCIGHPFPGPSSFPGPWVIERPDTLANLGFARQSAISKGSLCTFHFWSKLLPQSTAPNFTRPSKLSSSPPCLDVVFFP